MDSSMVTQLLDPEVRALLEVLDFPPILPETLVQARASRQMNLADIELSNKVLRRNEFVPGRSGDPDVMLRIHTPVDATGLLPCMVWIHGGGLVIGTANGDDLRFDRWCVRHQMVAVSIEYRLAPETPFPGPINDCYAGLQWVAAHADELGVDPSRIGIAGASAGGGLAASLALMARDLGGPAIRSQLLIYPMIDDRIQTESSSWNVPIWSPASNLFGWTSYLGDRRGSADVSPYAAASRATDLRGLPPTLIVVGTLDGFVDEDLDYAKRLNHAGVPIDLHLYAGAPHGFDGLLPSSAIAKRCAADTHAWIAKVYAPV
jgi:acetyl esterase/lipase